MDKPKSRFTLKRNRQERNQATEHLTFKDNKGRRPVFAKRDDYLAFKDHATDIAGTPVFLISCHSAICTSYASCRTGRRYIRQSEDAGLPVFTIPAATYILNASQGGEVCTAFPITANILRYNIDYLRKFLLVEDKHDGKIMGEKKRNTNYGVQLQNLMRATNVTYPNISCTFTDDYGSTDLGVFDLTAGGSFTSSHSILDTTADGPYGDKSWFLDDIISAVYAKKGISSGIFVFIGCTPQYSVRTLNAIREGGAAMDEAIHLIYWADLLFNGLVPVAPVHTMAALGYALPKPVGTIARLYPNGRFMAATADEHGVTPASAFPLKKPSKNESEKRQYNNVKEERNAANKIFATKLGP